MTRLLPILILANLSFGDYSKTINEISYSGVPGYDIDVNQILEWSAASMENAEPKIKSTLKALPDLRIRWLGAFGYEISDARTTIFIDPFISRPNPTPNTCRRH